MVYNKSQGTVIILDNSTTAMTGHQDNLQPERPSRVEMAAVVDIPSVVKGIG